MSTRSSVYYWPGKKAQIHVYFEMTDGKHYMEVDGPGFTVLVEVPKDFVNRLSASRPTRPQAAKLE